MKSKTHALCLIVVSLLTKPLRPSNYEMLFSLWATNCGGFFCSERSDLASEEFKHLKARLRGHLKFINLQINIKYRGILDQMHLLMMHDAKRLITWGCKV